MPDNKEALNSKGATRGARVNPLLPIYKVSKNWRRGKK
jgi:hypothetical protein